MRWRERDKACCATLSEQRCSVISEKKEVICGNNQQRRLASKTPKEREAHLQRVQVNQQQRLASKTPEEREARLQQSITVGKPAVETGIRDSREQWSSQQARMNPQERRSAETVAERITYLLNDWHCHREQRTIDSDVPLFNQPAVQSKLNRFHTNQIYDLLAEIMSELSLLILTLMCVWNTSPSYIPLAITWILGQFLLNWTWVSISNHQHSHSYSTCTLMYIYWALLSYRDCPRWRKCWSQLWCLLYNIPHGQYGYTGHVIDLPSRCTVDCD